MLGLREVCRSVLNTNSLRFVAANAPAEVVSSYGTEQQRLARLSLQVASAALVQRLAHDGGFVGLFTHSPVPAVEAEGRTPLGCLHNRPGGTRRYYEG